MEQSFLDVFDVIELLDSSEFHCEIPHRQEGNWIRAIARRMFVDCHVTNFVRRFVLNRHLTNFVRRFVLDCHVTNVVRRFVQDYHVTISVRRICKQFQSGKNASHEATAKL